MVYFIGFFSCKASKFLINTYAVINLTPRTTTPSQPVITTRIYVLHKITIALKFMSYINSDLPVPVKKLQATG